jgi:hypothetical protein
MKVEANLDCGDIAAFGALIQPLIERSVAAAVADAFNAERDRVRAEKPAVDRVLLDQEEAAAALGVSPRKLFELRKLGLAFVRFGEQGQPRYRPQDLAEFAAKYLTTVAKENQQTEATLKIADRSPMKSSA